ncbi:hypothetical protein FRC02_004445 [Tulasnella sp. 418]|nr:hypothetical protein FRC02_004445 [Tulasnella sp. 418]
MAEQYSHVKFIGIDLFPAPGSSHPPSNAHFECYNMESYGLRIRDSTANLIHCRCIYSGLRDFRRLLREIHRVLRPNGLILSAEIDFYNNIPGVIVDSMPATRWVFERLRCYTQTKGLTLAFQPSNIRSMLELEGFTEIVTREVEIPLGNWMQEEVMRAIGSKAMEVAIGYMGSIRPAVLDAGGHTEGEIDARLQSAIGEIRDSHGITMNYILIHARKVA